MIKQGTKVKWNWAKGTGKGKVIATYIESVTKDLEGNSVTRHGQANNKALLIEQQDGDKVLKLESEVDRIS